MGRHIGICTKCKAFFSTTEIQRSWTTYIITCPLCKKEAILFNYTIVYDAMNNINDYKRIGDFCRKQFMYNICSPDFLIEVDYLYLNTLSSSDLLLVNSFMKEITK